MASAKQIKARKLFAKRAKRGDFKKAITKTTKVKGSKKGYGFKDLMMTTPIPKGSGFVIISWTEKKKIAQFKKLGYNVTTY